MLERAATIGVQEASAACSIAGFETCDTSASIPSAFSSAIACRPSALRPPCPSFGSAPAWLSDLTIVDFRIGNQKFDIRFWREDGETAFEVWTATLIGSSAAH